jgi:bacteriophage N4 adsorption protein B
MSGVDGSDRPCDNVLRTFAAGSTTSKVILGLWSWWVYLGWGFGWCDIVAARVLFPLALIILVSGLDDLVLDAICLWGWLRHRLPASLAISSSETPREKTIAIFVPLWHEHGVIRGMVEHNSAAIHYENYHFFIGAYPNDDPTLDAVRDLESRFPHVHLAVCPHNGPTSKADCLNWIYQRMLLFEELQDPPNARFDIVITHDAEDLIHPEAFSFINAYADEYEMVQIPVLPLPTPLGDFVHGIYCDEFAEWQMKDMRARQLMGSFIPSNGVGTGFTRGALEKLANAENNLIFEPTCLTEDYENGLRLHKLGCKQCSCRSPCMAPAWWPRASCSRRRRGRPSVNAPAGSWASGCNAGNATDGAAIGPKNIGFGVIARAC